MRKGRQFVGMPVISLEEGQQIGTIGGLVINPARKNVAALIIEQKGWFREQKFIPFNKVHSIGEDAVTIERGSRAERGISLPEILKLFKERVNIAGSRLVAENGTAMGIVEEYYIDLQTGDIVGLEFSSGTVSNLFKGSAFLDINYVRTLGQAVIICSDSCLDNVVKLDGGLQERFRLLSNNTKLLLGTTAEKTRQLGRSLNQSIEKIKRDRKTGEEAGADEKQDSGGTPDINEDKEAAGMIKPPASPQPPEESPKTDERDIKHV